MINCLKFNLPQDMPATQFKRRDIVDSTRLRGQNIVDYASLREQNVVDYAALRKQNIENEAPLNQQKPSPFNKLTHKQKSEDGDRVVYVFK